MPRIDEPVPEGAVALPLSGKNGVGFCTWVSAHRLPMLHGLTLCAIVARKCTYVSAHSYDGIWVRRALLHRLLFPRWSLVEHAGGDGTDNRDHMLRLATRSQNMANTGKMAGRKGTKPTSKYKGVGRTKSGTWQVQIKFHGESMYLGVFASEEEAARAFDRKAVELHGEFAAVNFPDEHPLSSEPLITAP